MKIIFGFVLILSFYSCGNNQESWLAEYAEIKCAYITQVSLRDSAKKFFVKDLLRKSQEIELKLDSYSKKYDYKIFTLNQKIEKAQTDYYQKYRKESDSYTRVHGHVSSPDYEKRVESLQRNRDKLIQQYQIEIKEIAGQKNEDPVIQELAIFLEEKNTEIVKSEGEVMKKYKASIDSLQKLLNFQNSEFKEIASSLSKKELKKFTNERDSLMVNPCQGR